MDTMGEILAKKTIQTLRDSRVAKFKVDTIGHTLAMKKANGLLYALAYILTQVTQALKC